MYAKVDCHGLYECSPTKFGVNRLSFRDVARIFTVGGLSHQGAETKSRRCLGSTVWGAGVPLHSGAAYYV